MESTSDYQHPTADAQTFTTTTPHTSQTCQLLVHAVAD